MRRAGVIALVVLASTLTFPNYASASPVYSFTNAAATGNTGPTQSQVNTAYTSTTLASSVTINTQGIQEWVVPFAGSYEFKVVGAHGAASTQGSNTRGGRSAVVTATKILASGTRLFIVVGQAGSANAQHGGGGGASFVRIGTGTDNSNLIVAGGGGGTRQDASANGGDASLTTSGKSPGSGYSSGSTTVFSDNTAANSFTSGSTFLRGTQSNAFTDIGYGGLGAGSQFGDGGAGWFGNGYDDGGGTTSVAIALSSTALGGAGGTSLGGFGGGGNGAGGNGGGGGGGYTGGNGGWIAGGGGTYTSGFSSVVTALDTTRSFNRAGTAVHGYVTITSLGPSLTTFAPTTTLTNSTSITYDIVFSQSVTGLAAADFTKSGTGSSTCTIGTPSGSTTTYTVTLSGCSPGTVILTLAANSVANTSSQTAPASNTAAATVTIDQTAPTIATVAAPANKTYIPSETPTFTVLFSESVTVTGTPRLTLTVGSSTEYANFLSMSDSKTALFRYTVASDPVEFDTDGISLSTSLDLNSGTIRDLATNTLSNTSLTAPTLTSVLVAQPPAAPTIDSITATSGTLTVYFTPGATRGSAITNYTYATNGTTFKARGDGTTASPLVITTVSTGATNLANGTGYQIRIRAVSAAGTSDQSNLVNETPTAVSVIGDSTLTLTYGASASTSAYSATGGTGTYTWSLGSTLTGITLSGTTVTAGATTPAGSYSQTVRATDGNNQVGTKSLTITVAKASTSITIALPNSATNAALGGAITITATVPRAGAVNFRLGGTTISGCGSASAATTTATCSWTPASLGSVSLTAIFTPTDTSNFETSTSTTLSITVVNGVSTVTLSLAGGTTTPPKGQAINIIAAVDQDGRITFFVDGKRVPGCINRAATVGNINCSWKPAVQKAVTISARLVPTNNVYNASTSSMNVQVVRRSGAR
jgi:hypothetical protein